MMSLYSKGKSYNIL
uniref:Uncharacterized protein n=1 Tax=Anguilla anguilla TaxID=7936 RepID=A0A0E9Q1H7_ANGAN